MEYKHTPVMIQEVIDHLAIKRGGYSIDCTLGSGAYAEAISKKVGDKGKVLAIDLDERAIENTRKKKIKNIILANDNFKNIKNIIKKNFPEGIYFDAIVLDLGLSSYQLEDRTRGFSYHSDDSIDMAFGLEIPKSTEYIVNNYKEEDLRRILFEYGEEHNASRIARAIVEARKVELITDSKKLAQLVNKVSRAKKQKINPATKTFQALRIETNDELKSLKKVLIDATASLKKGGRLAVVSFHSLEDRIVKEFFKRESSECLCPPVLPVCVCGHNPSLKIITKKPVIPTAGEVKSNPRSRSAKLRVAEKV